MTVPHYIGEAKSDMRGIKPGWYAMDDDGNLVSGPIFQSREMRREKQSANKWINRRLGCFDGQMRSVLTSNQLALRAASGGPTKTALKG